MEQSQWATNIDKLLSEPLFKNVHKIGSVENEWFLLSYKSAFKRISPKEDWIDMYNICVDLLKNSLKYNHLVKLKK